MIFYFLSARLSHKTKTSDDEAEMPHSPIRRLFLLSQSSLTLFCDKHPGNHKNLLTLQETGGIFMDTGNTGFIMICAALVFIMTPGLAFFYGGLVRRKNVS